MLFQETVQKTLEHRVKVLEEAVEWLIDLLTDTKGEHESRNLPRV